MNQPTLLERAKQGDDDAIASVLNYLLKDRNITAKVAIKGNRLLVLLKSAQVPEQESSVTVVRKLMKQLNVESIKSVEVYGKQIGQQSTAWRESLDLTAKAENNQKLSYLGKKFSDGKLKVKDGIASSLSNTNRWPIWLPYPSSWIRAIVLVPIAFPGARLILFGFGGVILLTISGNEPALFIFFILFGLLLPTILLAFIYHFFWFIWRKKPGENNSFRWLPGANSWWESFYGVVVIGVSFITIFTLIAGLAFLFCQLSHQTGEEVAGCVGRATGKAARGIFCSIDRFFESSDGSAIFKDRDNIATQPWFVLWLIIASYLYQAEYLMRHHLLPKLKNGRGEYQFFRNILDQKNKKLFKTTLIISLIPLVAVGIYLGSKLPQLNGVNPSVPVASQSPLPKPSPSPILESSPIPSPSPISSPQSDAFREAVNKAISAAQLTQSAKSKADWNQVANEWESSIALMKAVPESSPNYPVAQKKAIEYQSNLDYAKRAANLAR